MPRLVPKLFQGYFVKHPNPKPRKFPKSREIFTGLFFTKDPLIRIIRYCVFSSQKIHIKTPLFLHLWPLQAHSSQTMDSKHSRVAETRSVATGSPDANSSRSSRDEVENVVKAAATCVGREKNKILFGRNRANQLIW